MTGVNETAPASQGTEQTAQVFSGSQAPNTGCEIHGVSPSDTAVTPCRSCHGPSHGRALCAWCASEQGDDQLVAEAAAEADEAIRATVSQLEDTIADLRDEVAFARRDRAAAEAHLHSRIAELEAKLLDREQSYLDCYEDLLRVVQEREALRTRLADEVGRSIEARAAELIEAGADSVVLSYTATAKGGFEYGASVFGVGPYERFVDGPFGAGFDGACRRAKELIGDRIAKGWGRAAANTTTSREG